MKIALAFVTLLVGTLASPAVPTFFKDVRVQQASRNERIVTGQIVQAIEDIAQQIRDAGLDPLNIDATFERELPVPVIFSGSAVVENLEFTGLSNIVVQSINFSILQSRLTFNIVLPGLALSIDNAAAQAVFFGKDYEASISGSLNINEIRIIGDIRVNVGIVSGISIRSLSLQFSLGGIESNLNINLLGNDLSSRVNTLLGTTIPNTLNEFRSEINELIELIAWDVINDALNSGSFM